MRLELPPVPRSSYSALGEACSIATRSRSTSSSSAVILASAVRTPWPISLRPTTSTTRPSASIRSQELGRKGPAAGRRGAGAFGVEPEADQQPAAGERGEAEEVAPGGHRPPPSRAVDGLADARVAAAAAEVVAQRGLDLGLRRRRSAREQRGDLDDHPGLAVAALRDALLEPGALDRVRAVRREPLDRRVALAGGRGEVDLAGAHGDALLEHRAGAAHSFAAAVLGAGQAENVAQVPEQRHARRRFGLPADSVDEQGELGHRGLPGSMPRGTWEALRGFGRPGAQRGGASQSSGSAACGESWTPR